jgi:hypothetical protein
MTNHPVSIGITAEQISRLTEKVSCLIEIERDSYGPRTVILYYNVRYNTFAITCTDVDTEKGASVGMYSDARLAAKGYNDALKNHLGFELC